MCKMWIWELLTCGAFCSVGTLDEKVTGALGWLDSDLDHFYKRQAREKERETLTRVTSLSNKRVGKTDERKLATKGSETYGLLIWMIDLTETAGHLLSERAHRFCDAGRLLTRIVEIWRVSPARMGEADIQECWGCWMTYCKLVDGEEELRGQPKKHSTAHMLAKMRWFGNPRMYSNWLDESLNKLLKQSCRFCSQATLETSVLIRMRQTLRKEILKRKRDDLL